MKQEKKIITAECLCKTYGGGNVLDQISLQIEQGEFVVIMGQSGCGKSTLLYCVSGMDQPTKGTVCFDGEELGTLSGRQLQQLRLEHMGFVFQKTSFLNNLSVLDNIIYPAFQLGKVSRTQILARARQLMQEMGIEPIGDRDIHQVSGGQLQRAAICRAMINEPDMIFGDEPTGALNSSATAEVLRLLGRINRQGTTVLLATHDAHVAVRADRVIYLEDGSVMDTLSLGRYEEADAARREETMKNWLEKMGF